MRHCRNNISIAERIPAIIFLIEYFYLGIIVNQAKSPETLRGNVYSMWTLVFLISFMGHRLIYQNTSEKNSHPILREYGSIWFMAFYTFHLGFSFFLDVWFAFFCNGRWTGLLLFALKLAAVLYVGAVLYRETAASNLRKSEQDNARAKSPPGDRLDVLGIIGITVLLVVEVCFVTSISPLYDLLEILELAIFAILLFRKEGKATAQAHEL